ncbi:sucrose-6-phosphate hydrolase [Aerococcus sanguinicola]|uniref:sucrose-6-phosphate hydrolase n=1 Tax=Aerococcus sanguinicola TaxID=119206 RepID=UPI0018A78605|nr:sucrose-6-phosphate hydrolase [Aerococcus sanguinicola]
MEWITDWTRELRYTPYADWPEGYQESLRKSQAASDWRAAYHIQPAGGLLNDPNGFSYFNGQWQLFYQYYPYGPVHGLKSWYQMTSDNLVDWQDQGLALQPDTPYDSHGVYSGSALPVGDKLFLMYTGNVRDVDGDRETYQMGAWLAQDGQIEKIDQVLIHQPQGYTADFRDPQIFRRAGQYWICIGAQTVNREGRVLMYKSDDLLNWEMAGELDLGQADLGYMVECPNLVFIDDQPVLIFCPQGLDQETAAYANIYPNMYIVGRAFDWDKLAFVDPSPMQLVDQGFDLYASQAIQAPDGRVLAVSWLGLPDMPAVTAEEGWAHSLSLVKELTLVDGRLYQRPVDELHVLRQDSSDFSLDLAEGRQSLPSLCAGQEEIQIHLAPGSKGRLELFAAADAEGAVVLAFDLEAGQLTLEQTAAGVRMASDYGYQRALDLPAGQALNLTLYLDHSLLEIFVNGGGETLTTPVYPRSKEAGQTYIQGSGQVSGQVWALRAMEESVTKVD